MQTAEFLRHLFPIDGPDDPRGNDLIRFAVVPPGQTFPGTVHWKSRSSLHQLTESGISALGFDSVGKDVYFTPHGFIRRGRDCTKEDAVPLLDVAWVELDDNDISPATFNPAPSFVVNTSPGRHHLYWLLDTPLPAEDVEKINFRLAYGHNLREDKGGWALTKWLRLPGAISYKRQAPHPVTITAAEPTRRYLLSDFDDLPAAPELLLSTGRLPDTPNIDNLPTREDLAEQYSFSHELSDLLDRRRPDRSSALWRIYHLAYTAGMTEEECFALVYNSANDKFHQEWRYNSDEDLWKDIYRGYRMANTPSETPILTTLKRIRGQSGTPVAERRRTMSVEIMKDLNTRGCLYWDTERQEALYYDGRNIIPMNPTSQRWKTLLNIHYWIVDGEAEFKAINETLTAFVNDRGVPVVPRTSYFWNKTEGLLYVYNGEGYVYRLDGEQIELVRNGTDGVLFRDLPNMEPFIAEPPTDDTPSLVEALFGLPNYDEQLARHSKEQAIAMFQLWTYSLFFSEYMDAQPHLIIAGPTDSGKSLALQAVGELLLGSNTTVSAVPTDRDTFETIVSNAHHVFLDNVDTPNKWMEDALCEVATGIQFTRRKLYTTNDHVSYKVKCHLGMTTRNHWFTRGDVATRLVVLYVDRRGEKISPTLLLDRIRNNRNQLWWLLLNDLNKIVATLKTWRPKQHNLRMAAYADFVMAAVTALGWPEMNLLHILEANQKQTARDASILWNTLEYWIRQTTNDPTTNEPVYRNNDQWTTAAKLHTELRTIAEGIGARRDYERQVPNARSLAQQLKELARDIESVVKMDMRSGNPSNLYKFTFAEGVVPRTTDVKPELTV